MRWRWCARPGSAASSSTPTPMPTRCGRTSPASPPRRSSPTSPSGWRLAAASGRPCRCSAPGRSSPSTPTSSGAGRTRWPRWRRPGPGTERCWRWCRGRRPWGTAGRATSSCEPGGALRRRGAAPAADHVYAGAEIIDIAALDGVRGDGLLAQPGLGRARGPRPPARPRPSGRLGRRRPARGHRPRRGGARPVTLFYPAPGPRVFAPAAGGRLQPRRWSPASTRGSRASRRRRWRGSRSG